VAADFGGDLVDFEARLRELGIHLPEAPRPVAAYVPCVVTGDLVFTSGQLPVQEGALLFAGRVGDELTVEEAQAAARLCVLNCLAVVRTAAGNLDNVTQIVKLNGYVASAPGFHEQPRVLNGASELLEAVFGTAGRHARAAVGVAALPLRAPVELDLIVKISK
jgi:enamine deaminase RidA (YjgF/YER057c/UK114 family)